MIIIIIIMLQKLTLPCQKVFCYIGWIDSWMDKSLDEWMDGWINVWMEGWTNGYGYAYCCSTSHNAAKTSSTEAIKFTAKAGSSFAAIAVTAVYATAAANAVLSAHIEILSGLPYARFFSFRNTYCISAKMLFQGEILLQQSVLLITCWQDSASFLNKYQVCLTFFLLKVSFKRKIFHRIHWLRWDARL